MHKDFWTWHAKKEKVDEKGTRVFFHEREIWFCHLGTNVGFEQDGKGDNFGRPIIIFRKFNKEVFWGVPLTTRDKGGKFYLPVASGDGQSRMAILSQLRLLDAKRLYQKVGTIDKETHARLTDAIIKLAQGK
ncbi:MAG: type II toxin-antitoxin system PemK/MazF family toxin [Patescibacteria group bacterium]